MSRRILVVLSLVFVLLLATAGVALAQSATTKQVGLVIAFPDGTSHTEIVTVPVAATTLDVLKTAKITLVSQSSSFGESICKINNTGCPADNCFCDPDAFWAYYHLDGSAWASSMEGVGGYVPADQAVEGFAWSGFDAQFNPTVQPPVFTFAQLLAMVNQPVPVPEPGTLLLLGGGVATLAAYIRRKRAA